MTIKQKLLKTLLFLCGFASLAVLMIVGILPTPPGGLLSQVGLAGHAFFYLLLGPLSYFLVWGYGFDLLSVSISIALLIVCIALYYSWFAKKQHLGILITALALWILSGGLSVLGAIWASI